jgi:isoquinoline 1-oxidoreductase subunit beta
MIQQQNFNSYEVLRMPDAPRLETHLVEGGRPPGGIGEPPLALIAPSVANAVFNATGKRLRELPLRLDEMPS